ncbi:sugar kinase [Aeromonas cavernicola]|uniref:2-dehydro-3-deoxygluconokinase n=1 Tax=Aeromonas cavernicola TaxID=1006623 RepID=A0A2H9U5F8_9GAMM|nr:sugar kinase [Aeromonas cavernicola]PJG59260.1 ketodeoxygluconokinase [Aeromonas cavernicola]
MRIVMMGECMIELNGSPFGAMHQAFGGDSLNTALYLKRAVNAYPHPISVSYLTAMGVDPLSKGIVAQWRQAGLDTSLVLTDDQRQPGLYLIQLDEQGERTFLYWRNESAARYMLRHEQFPSVIAALADVDIIYLSGITLAILPDDDRRTLLQHLTRLHQQGKKIVFDSNYRPVLWHDPDIAKHYYQQLLSITWLGLLTDDDEATLWGDKSVDETLCRLHALGLEEVVIKRGGDGCLYQNIKQGEPPLHIPAVPVATIVDTTSAGDSFNAGFLAGRLTGKSALASAQMGHQLAAIVIQHRGAIVPTEATDPVVDSFFI